MTRQHNLTIKSISLLLTFAFIFSELAFAGALESQGVFQPTPTPKEIILKDPTRFEAPVESTILKEIHRGDSGTFIIHIQDAHVNTSGQANLASALDTLMSKYKIGLVLVEGGTRDDTLTPIKQVAPPDVWKKVAKKFLMEGKISGEEYLNLTSDHPMKIMGIENKELYQKSLAAYADMAKQRPEILEYLKKIQYAVDKLKRRLYPKELLEYERGDVISRRVSAERSHHTVDEISRPFGARNDNVDGYKSLFNLAKEKQVDLKDFPAVQQLAVINEKENTIDFNLANLEQAALVEEIQKRGGGEELRSFIDKLGHLSKQKLAQFSYFQNTLDIARSKNITLDKYPNLILYLDYLKQFSGLDLDRVLDELEKAEDKVYAVILRSPKGDEESQKRDPSTTASSQNDVKVGHPRVSGDQVSDDSRVCGNDSLLLRSIDRYLGLLTTAYQIKMTTKEFNLFVVNEPDFSTLSYQAFLNKKLLEYGFFDEVIEYKDILDSGKRALEDFYESVNQRDVAFIENSERILKAENEKIAFLISGGYHTEHLKKLFKEKGYSYAVLSPIITSETNQAKYEKLLLESVREKPKVVQSTHGVQKDLNQSLSDLEEDLIHLKKMSDGVSVSKIGEPENGARLAKLVKATVPNTPEGARLGAETLLSFATRDRGAKNSSLRAPLQRGKVPRQARDGEQSRTTISAGTRLRAPGARLADSRRTNRQKAITTPSIFSSRRFVRAVSSIVLSMTLMTMAPVLRPGQAVAKLSALWKIISGPAIAESAKPEVYFMQQLLTHLDKSGGDETMDALSLIAKLVQYHRLQTDELLPYVIKPLRRFADEEATNEVAVLGAGVVAAGLEKGAPLSDQELGNLINYYARPSDAAIYYWAFQNTLEKWRGIPLGERTPTYEDRVKDQIKILKEQYGSISLEPPARENSVPHTLPQVPSAPDYFKRLYMHIQSETASLGLDPDEVVSIIVCESDAIPNAQGKKGDRGLMMLRELAVQKVKQVYSKDPNVRMWDYQRSWMDPEGNVSFGVRYLATLGRNGVDRSIPPQLKGFDYRSIRLAAYNGGETNLDNGIVSKAAILYAKKVSYVRDAIKSTEAQLARSGQAMSAEERFAIASKAKAVFIKEHRNELNGPLFAANDGINTGVVSKVARTAGEPVFSNLRTDDSLRAIIRRSEERRELRKRVVHRSIRRREQQLFKGSVRQRFGHRADSRRAGARMADQSEDSMIEAGARDIAQMHPRGAWTGARAVSHDSPTRIIKKSVIYALLLVFLDGMVPFHARAALPRFITSMDQERITQERIRTEESLKKALVFTFFSIAHRAPGRRSSLKDVERDPREILDAVPADVLKRLAIKEFTRHSEEQLPGVREFLLKVLRNTSDPELREDLDGLIGAVLRVIDEKVRKLPQIPTKKKEEPTSGIESPTLPVSGARGAEIHSLIEGFGERIEQGRLKKQGAVTFVFNEDPDRIDAYHLERAFPALDEVVVMVTLNRKKFTKRDLQKLAHELQDQAHAFVRIDKNNRSGLLGEPSSLMAQIGPTDLVFKDTTPRIDTEFVKVPKKTMKPTAPEVAVRSGPPIQAGDLISYSGEKGVIIEVGKKLVFLTVPDFDAFLTKKKKPKTERKTVPQKELKNIQVIAASPSTRPFNVGDKVEVQELEEVQEQEEGEWRQGTIVWEGGGYYIVFTHQPVPNNSIFLGYGISISEVDAEEKGMMRKLGARMAGQNSRNGEINGVEALTRAKALAYERRSELFSSGENYYAHAERVVEELRRMRTVYHLTFSDEVLAAAWLHVVDWPTNLRDRESLKKQLPNGKIWTLVENFHAIQNLPYNPVMELDPVTGEMVVKDPETLESQIGNILARIKDPEVLFLVFADQLATIKMLTPQEADYVIRRTLHVDSTLAALFDYEQVAEALKDAAFRQKNPVGYKAAEGQLVETNKVGRAEAEELVEKMGREIGEYLDPLIRDAGYYPSAVIVRIIARVKSIPSIMLKEREILDYNGVFVITNHPEEAAYIRNQLEHYTGLQTLRETRVYRLETNGFAGFQLYKRDGTVEKRPYSIFVMDKENYERYRYGNRAHWKYNTNKFPELRSQRFRLLQVFRPTKDIHKDFESLKNLLAGRVFLSVTGDRVTGDRKSFSPFHLPSGAKPSDAAYAVALNPSGATPNSFSPVEVKVKEGGVELGKPGKSLDPLNSLENGAVFLAVQTRQMGVPDRILASSRTLRPILFSHPYQLAGGRKKTYLQLSRVEKDDLIKQGRKHFLREHWVGSGMPIDERYLQAVAKRLGFLNTDEFFIFYSEGLREMPHDTRELIRSSAATEGKEKLADVMGQPVEYLSREEIRMRAEAVLGVFPKLWVGSEEILFAKVGIGQISDTVVADMLSQEACMDASVKWTAEGYPVFEVDYKHDRSGIVLAVLRAFEKVNIASIVVPQNTRMPITVTLSQRLGIDKLAVIQRALERIPDIKILRGTPWVRADYRRRVVRVQLENKAGWLYAVAQAIGKLDPRIYWVKAMRVSSAVHKDDTNRIREKHRRRGAFPRARNGRFKVDEFELWLDIPPDLQEFESRIRGSLSPVVVPESEVKISGPRGTPVGARMADRQVDSSYIEKIDKYMSRQVPNFSKESGKIKLRLSQTISFGIIVDSINPHRGSLSYSKRLNHNYLFNRNKRDISRMVRGYIEFDGEGKVMGVVLEPPRIMVMGGGLFRMWGKMWNRTMPLEHTKIMHDYFVKAARFFTGFDAQRGVFDADNVLQPTVKVGTWIEEKDYRRMGLANPITLGELASQPFLLLREKSGARAAMPLGARLAQDKKFTPEKLKEIAKENAFYVRAVMDDLERERNNPAQMHPRGAWTGARAAVVEENFVSGDIVQNKGAVKGRAAIFSPRSVEEILYSFDRGRYDEEMSQFNEIVERVSEAVSSAYRGGEATKIKEYLTTISGAIGRYMEERRHSPGPLTSPLALLITRLLYDYYQSRESTWQGGVSTEALDKMLDEARLQSLVSVKLFDPETERDITPSQKSKRAKLEIKIAKEVVDYFEKKYTMMIADIERMIANREHQLVVYGAIGADLAAELAHARDDLKRLRERRHLDIEGDKALRNEKSVAVTDVRRRIHENKILTQRLKDEIKKSKDTVSFLKYHLEVVTGGAHSINEAYLKTESARRGTAAKMIGENRTFAGLIYKNVLIQLYKTRRGLTNKAMRSTFDDMINTYKEIIAKLIEKRSGEGAATHEILGVDGLEDMALIVRDPTNVGIFNEIWERYGSKIKLIIVAPTAAATVNTHWVIVSQGKDNPPAVLIVNNEQMADKLERVKPGDTILLMGETENRSGGAYINPDEGILMKGLEEARRADLYKKMAAKVIKKHHAKDFPLYANLTVQDDPRMAIRKGAMGVGLIRTEIVSPRVVQLILDKVLRPIREGVPIEVVVEELRTEFVLENLEILNSAALSGETVVFRTIDLGYDTNREILNEIMEMNQLDPLKATYEQIDSVSGFNFYRTPLGRRALIEHLASFYIAFGLLKGRKPKVGVMFPMVRGREDLDFVFDEEKGALKEALLIANGVLEGQPRARKVDKNAIKFGAMVENPEAVRNVKDILNHPSIRFLSVGTNDLTSGILSEAYTKKIQALGLNQTIVVSRDDPANELLFSRLRPEVLEVMEALVSEVDQYNQKHPNSPKDIGVCGEIAGTKRFALFWAYVWQKYPYANTYPNTYLSMSTGNIADINFLLLQLTDKRRTWLSRIFSKPKVTVTDKQVNDKAQEWVRASKLYRKAVTEKMAAEERRLARRQRAAGARLSKLKASLAPDFSIAGARLANGSRGLTPNDGQLDRRMTAYYSRNLLPDLATELIRNSISPSEVSDVFYPTAGVEDLALMERLIEQLPNANNLYLHDLYRDERAYQDFADSVQALKKRYGQKGANLSIRLLRGDFLTDPITQFSGSKGAGRTLFIDKWPGWNGKLREDPRFREALVRIAKNNDLVLSAPANGLVPEIPWGKSLSKAVSVPGYLKEKEFNLWQIELPPKMGSNHQAVLGNPIGARLAGRDEGASSLNDLNERVLEREAAGTDWAAELIRMFEKAERVPLAGPTQVRLTKDIRNQNEPVFILKISRVAWAWLSGSIYYAINGHMVLFENRQTKGRLLIITSKSTEGDLMMQVLNPDNGSKVIYQRKKGADSWTVSELGTAVRAESGFASGTEPNNPRLVFIDMASIDNPVVRDFLAGNPPAEPFTGGARFAKTEAAQAGSGNVSEKPFLFAEAAGSRLSGKQISTQADVNRIADTGLVPIARWYLLNSWELLKKGIFANDFGEVGGALVRARLVHGQLVLEFFLASQLVGGKIFGDPVGVLPISDQVLAAAKLENEELFASIKPAEMHAKLKALNDRGRLAMQIIAEYFRRERTVQGISDLRPAANAELNKTRVVIIDPAEQVKGLDPVTDSEKYTLQLELVYRKYLHLVQNPSPLRPTVYLFVSQDAHIMEKFSRLNGLLPGDLRNVVYSYVVNKDTPKGEIEGSLHNLLSRVSLPGMERVIDDIRDRAERGAGRGFGITPVETGRQGGNYHTVPVWVLDAVSDVLSRYNADQILRNERLMSFLKDAFGRSLRKEEIQALQNFDPDSDLENYPFLRAIPVDWDLLFEVTAAVMRATGGAA